MQYTYAPKPVNATLLQQQIIALALPVAFSGLAETADYQLAVILAGPLSDADKARLDAVIAAHDASQLTADQQAAIDAANAHAAAISLDTPISDLQAARDALQAARTTLATAVGNVDSADNTIANFAGQPTLGQLTTAVKALSAATRAFVDAQAQGDLALANGELALANALMALKTRFS